jgi:hypothetical protein
MLHPCAEGSGVCSVWHSSDSASPARTPDISASSDSAEWGMPPRPPARQSAYRLSSRPISETGQDDRARARAFKMNKKTSYSRGSDMLRLRREEKTQSTKAYRKTTDTKETRKKKAQSGLDGLQRSPKTSTQVHQHTVTRREAPCEAHTDTHTDQQTDWNECQNKHRPPIPITCTHKSYQPQQFNRTSVQQA